MADSVEPLIEPIVPSPHQDHLARGIGFGLLAMFLLAIMYACSKILSANHNVIEIVFYRNIIGIVPLTIAVIATNRLHTLVTNKPVALFFRVLIGAIGLGFTMWAFALLSMANATLIIMTSVLIVPMLAYFILNEQMGKHRWAAIVIGLVGVAIMVRPTGNFALLGTLVGFGTAILQACTQIFLRHLRTESSFMVTFYFILGGAIVSGLCMPFIAKTPELWEWPLLIGVGVSGASAQFCLTSAYRSAPAGVIAPLNYTGLIWASLFDIAIWKDIPDTTVFIGAAIIIVSQAYIVYRERLAKKRSNLLKD